MLDWWSSPVRSSVARKSVGLALCLALALPVSMPAAAQHTSSKRSPASSSTRKPAASTKREPIRTLQVTPQGETIGSPWTGQLGVRETTGQIMRRERANGAQKPEGEETEAEKVLPRRDLLPVNPLSPQDSQWPPKNGGEPPSPVLASPQTTGLNFTGATLAETAAAFPPDSMGTVGPTQFVVAVNNRIKVFDKTTGALGALDSSTNTFFDSVRNGSRTSDPRVRYDRLSGRWFILIINVAMPTNRVLLAVSDNGTITAGTVWTFFFFQQDQVSPIGESGCLSDYPTLGIDANALYIGVNQFCPSFGGTTAFVVRKSSVLGAGPIVASAFRNLTGTPGGPGLYTPQGVDNYDPAATEGYFIGVDNATFGTLVVRRVSNPGGTPVLSTNAFITVPSTSFPLTVPHQGNTNGNNGRLDGLDDRLFAAHIRNGHLWTAQNIAVDNTGTTVGVGTRNASRWYELTGLNTGAPTLVQAGTLFAATPTNSVDDRHYWIPSIMVSGQGHAAMGVSTAGTNEFVNAATVGRLASDPLGTLETPILFTSSPAAYNPPGNDGSSRGRRRWGDYSYTSLDPCDDMTMWTIQEFCDALDSYGVRIVKLIAPPPVTPISANPAFIPQGQSSINVTVSGVATGGKGFYDPGPGFACRLAASIGGGIAVNSVTYNSPNTITLNISTVSALIGSKSISVTNPDGQSATGSLLTVGAPGSCSFTLNSTTQNFAATGGTGGFNVTTAGGCAWTATSNDSWITITSGSGGTGNGAVTYSVSNNPGGGSRTGTMTIGGVSFIVTQDGTGVCSFSIAPTSQNFVVGGGTGSVSVTADVGCAWTATSNAGFISITSGSSGTGNGAVNYSVSANPTTSPRTGTMTIAGLTFTVTQDPTPCAFMISPTSQTFTSTGGTGSVAVNTQGGCAWTASSNDPFISITSGSSGTGNGAVNYSVAANPVTSPRTGTMTIAGLTFTVTQDALPCVFTISPTSQTFASPGGTGSVSVTTQTGCAWNATSNAPFINITSGSSGTGNGAVNYSVAANPVTSPRTGTMTIAGLTFTVTQDAMPCVFTISPTNQTFASPGGTGSVAVTTQTGCAWTATSNDTWVSVVSGASGTGAGAVNYSVAPNISGVSRTGTMTAAGRTFTVNQSGVSSISYNRSDFDGDGKADIGFYRDGLWGVLKSSQSYSFASAQFFGWGGAGLQPISADFDGDGKADIAYIVPPSGGQSAAYAILRSSTNYAFAQAQFLPAGFPSLGDTPVVGDFDGDGKADPGIWRASQGVWIIPKSSTNYTTAIFAQWGQLGDIPVIADFDGDGKADMGFNRNGLWGVLKSSQNYSLASAQFFSWGGASLQPIVADFDGDGKADIAYMVPPAGGQSAAYAILKSSTNYNFTQAQFLPAGWPSLGDTPVVGTFDGDAKADPGIWRSSQGVWILPLSSGSYSSFVFTQWGQNGDVPLPNSIGRF